MVPREWLCEEVKICEGTITPSLASWMAAEPPKTAAPTPSALWREIRTADGWQHGCNPSAARPPRTKNNPFQPFLAVTLRMQQAEE
jgi:hypothetical protein